MASRKELKTTDRSVFLEHSPVSLNLRSVHLPNTDGMQVVISVDASCFSSNVYMTTAEARRVAEALNHAADFYDAQRAELLEPTEVAA
nr:hypothetical protein [Luteimonas sp. XNQY3]